MGYTHYWRKTKELDEKQYAEALKDIAKIVKSQITILADGSGDKGTKPKVSGGIDFNGIEEGSHENFSLPKSAAGLQNFEFCKTSQKPYDKVVVAALSRLAEVDGMKISSDGSGEEWDEGVRLASKVLGRDVANPLKSKEDKKEEAKKVTTKPSLKIVKSSSWMAEVNSQYQIVVAALKTTDPKFYKKRGFGPTSMETEEWISKIVQLRGKDKEQMQCVKDLLESIDSDSNERYVLNNLAARRINTKGLRPIGD